MCMSDAHIVLSETSRWLVMVVVCEGDVWGYLAFSDHDILSWVGPQEPLRLYRRFCMLQGYPPIVLAITILPAVLGRKDAPQASIPSFVQHVTSMIQRLNPLAVTTLLAAVPLHPNLHQTIGEASLALFKSSKSPVAADVSVICHILALWTTPPDSTAFTARVHATRDAFLQHPTVSGDVSGVWTSVNKAASLIKIPVPITTAAMASMIYEQLGMRFQDLSINGNIRSLTNAVSYLEAAIACAISDPKLAPTLPALHRRVGKAYFDRFKKTQELEDLSLAVENLERPLIIRDIDLTRAPLNSDTDRLEGIETLIFALAERFNLHATGDDLLRGIQHLNTALSCIPPGVGEELTRQQLLDNLGMFHSRAFDFYEKEVHANAAIHAFTAAVDLCTRVRDPSNDDNARVSLLAKLAYAYAQSRGIEEALRMAQLKLPRRLYVAGLGALGTKFVSQYGSSGNLNNLYHGIGCFRLALKGAHPGTSKDSRLRQDLASALYQRYQHMGVESDLDEAIEEWMVSKEEAGEGNVEWARGLPTLSNALVHRYEKRGNADDLAYARASLNEYIRLFPTTNLSPSAAVRIEMDIGMVLINRFNATNDPNDLDAAIKIYEEAIRNRGSSKRKQAHMGLAHALSRRFQITGNVPDGRRAVENLQVTISHTTNDHPDYAAKVKDLGVMFVHLFKATGVETDYAHAIQSFAKASSSSTAPPWIQLDAAKMWATFAGETGRLDGTLVAWRVFVDRLYEAAGLERSIEERYARVVEHSGWLAQVLPLAIGVGKWSEGFELHEHGRCLVWNQIYQLRTPLGRLRETNPDLAQRLERASRYLEVSSTTLGRRLDGMVLGGPGETDEDREGHQSASSLFGDQHNAYQRIKWAKEWHRALHEIRQLDGWTDFLRPPNAAGILSRVPAETIIVFLHTHPVISGAFLVVEKEARYIHLKGFKHERAQELSERLGVHLRRNGVRLRGARGLAWEADDEVNLRSILAELWDSVVKPIINELGLAAKKRGDPTKPRLWWCPTGPSTFLPLHAAGIYGADRVLGDCISDYAVSSYTPNLTTLLTKFEEPTCDAVPPAGLLVGQSDTPGLPPILGTVTELDSIQKMMKSHDVPTTRLDGASATKDVVLQTMKGQRWAHFACHALQDAANPLKSGICLHDERLTLMDVMQERDIKMDHVFLSACQTCTGEQTLVEEAVHISSGMLASGCKGVVSTMWSISDWEGPKIAEDFYRYLMTGREGAKGPATGIAFGGAAYALHRAMEDARERLGESEDALLSWVPYVHFGL